jgi:hypothetical protein
VNVKLKKRQSQAAQKLCLCLRVDNITVIHLKILIINTSGLKCIVLEIGVFLLIVLYTMFPIMVEYCVQEYIHSGFLVYSRVW